MILAVAVVWPLLSFSVILQNHLAVVKLAGAEESTQIPHPTTSKFVMFNGTKYGTIIQYPDNWKINEDSTGVWFVSPIDETGNVRIESQPAKNGSLALMVQAQLLQSKQSYKELDIASSNITTLDGVPGNRTDYKFKVEVPKFLGSDIFDYTAFQISAVKGDRLYTFTYFSTPQNFHLFLPIVHKMLSTFKIS